MYSFDDIFTGVQNPRRVARELNRLYHTRGKRYSHNPRGSSIFEKDWDNLIILDACRYDAFRDHADIKGELTHRWSLGGTTREFVRANFRNRKLHDTVYVGANTWYLKLKDELNSEIHRFVDLQSGEYDVTWADEALRVVVPESVTEQAVRLHDEYPNKRLLIHYLQPHHPFIGEFGSSQFTYQSSSLLDVVAEADEDVTRESVWQSYVENLDRVIKEAKRCISELDGKSIITADHGEMLGDRHDFVPIRDYGHHEGIYNAPTTKVPLVSIQQGKRREIRSEKPERSQNVNQADLDQQLRDLGYKL